MSAVSGSEYNGHWESAWLIHKQRTRAVSIADEKMEQGESGNLSLCPHLIILSSFIPRLLACLPFKSLLLHYSLFKVLYLSPTLSFVLTAFHSSVVGEPLGAHLQSSLSFHGLWKWMFYCLH